MTRYVALLRAVNVGGTGVLPMKALREVCAGLGLAHVRTYIQSGNVVFESPDAEARVTQMLEHAIGERLGRPVGVLVRTAAELRGVLEANPFPSAKPSQVGVLFLQKPPPAKSLSSVTIPGQEEVRAIGREVFIHYPYGMGRSKLRLPFAGDGTTRNVNTLTKLLAMAEAADC